MKNNKNKIDLILIRPNDKKAIYGGLPDSSTASDPPYWLALMGGWLQDKGISVKLIDAEYENQNPENTVAFIEELNPLLVGIMPLGSNLNTATWKMNGASILINLLKLSVVNLPIFIWGYHVSALPERTMTEEKIDYVISGEGFDTIYRLIFAIKKNTPIDEIQGLWYRKGKEIRGSINPQIIQNLDELPFDGWELLPKYAYKGHLHFSFEDLSKRNQYGAVMTSLGCPFNCSFCALKFFSGEKKVRYKSPASVVNEIEYLVNRFGVFFLRIIDECFTLNKERTIAVCDEIIKKQFNVSIWAYARADTLDKDLIEKLYKANIKWLGIGIESGNRHIRSNVSKGQYDVNKIKETLKMCNDAGISVCDNYMFGLPGDTIETMRDTLSLARELNCGYPNMYCTMAYPGSELYTIALKNGFDLPDSWLGYAQLSYETHPLPTENLSSKDILAFRDYAFEAFFKDNDAYFEMIRKKFGQPAVNAINDMLKGKIKRRLLGD